MLAVGLGVIVLIILGAVARSALAIGGAYALTTFVALPSLLDWLTWIAAGSFVLVQVLAAVVALAALANGAKVQRRFR